MKGSDRFMVTPNERLQPPRLILLLVAFGCKPRLPDPLGSPEVRDNSFAHEVPTRVVLRDVPNEPGGKRLLAA